MNFLYDFHTPVCHLPHTGQLRTMCAFLRPIFLRNMSRFSFEIFPNGVSLAMSPLAAYTLLFFIYTPLMLTHLILFSSCLLLTTALGGVSVPYFECQIHVGKDDCDLRMQETIHFGCCVIHVFQQYDCDLSLMLSIIFCIFI